MFDKSLGNRGDKDKHRRKSTVSQCADAEFEQQVAHQQYSSSSDRSTSKPFFLQPLSSRQVKQQRRSSFGLGGIGGNNNRGSNQYNEVWATVKRPNEHQLSHALAEYQVVFQQLKREFPTSASGALHQLTMARIAETKTNHEFEEKRQVNVLASKLVGMIMPADSNALSKQDPDNNNVGLRRPPYSDGGLRRSSWQSNTLGSDSTQSSLWNRRKPEDFINRSNSVFSLLQQSTFPPEDQALHIRCVSLLTRRTVSTADDSSRFDSNDNLRNFARKMSGNTVKEEEEEDNLIGTSHRWSDNYENVNATDHYLKSDLSGLFEVTDDVNDNDEKINVDDHYEDKGVHSVRSETELPSSHDATSQDDKKIDLLQNDSDGNTKSNVTQFLGLDLVKSLPFKTNKESDLQRITTMSVTSELTSSDCCSTTSSNLNGMIVGFSDQHTNHDGNDLLVGFVNRRHSESPYRFDIQI